MEMTRRVMTNVASATGNRGPMGQLIKARTYPDASFRDVTALNADTLYTTAPAGKFILMMRLYWPEETDLSILDGSWAIPPARSAS